MHNLTTVNVNTEVNSEQPLLLRRLQEKPVVTDPTASGHMTIVTTQSQNTEMNDQQEDATRYDKD